MTLTPDETRRLEAFDVALDGTADEMLHAALATVRQRTEQRDAVADLARAYRGLWVGCNAPPNVMRQGIAAKDAAQRRCYELGIVL